MDEDLQKEIDALKQDAFDRKRVIDDETEGLIRDAIARRQQDINEEAQRQIDEMKQDL